MNTTDALISRMEDIADKAVRSGWAASRFLTPSEAQTVAGRLQNKQVKFSFDGGFAGAERVRAVFVNPDWGEYQRADLLAALEITYRPQDSLGHRDILGAIMALGIERDTIGDIVGGDHSATLVCMPEMSGFISGSLTKSARVGLSVSEISLDQLPAKTEEMRIKSDTIASLRLDAVLSAAFGLSRSKAAGIIEEGRVSLDYQLCQKPSKELKEGALLSVRGVGRAKLLEIGGETRKGRIHISIGVYV